MLLNLILSNLSIVIKFSRLSLHILHTHIYLKTLFPNVIYKFTIHQKRGSCEQKTSLSIYVCVMQVKKHSAANQKTTFEGTEGSKYTNLIIHFGSLRLPI